MTIDFSFRKFYEQNTPGGMYTGGNSMVKDLVRRFGSTIHRFGIGSTGELEQMLQDAPNVLRQGGPAADALRGFEQEVVQSQMYDMPPGRMNPGDALVHLVNQGAAANTAERPGRTGGHTPTMGGQQQGPSYTAGDQARYAQQDPNRQGRIG